MTDYVNDHEPHRDSEGCWCCAEHEHAYLTAIAEHEHAYFTAIAEPPEPEPEKQISLRLPESLIQRVHNAAHERCVGRDLFLGRLIAEAMDALIPVDALTRLRAYEKEPTRD